MSVPKLSYFNIPGRAEAARLAFQIGGIKFEDHRIAFQEWGQVKSTTPWGSVPTLEWEGHVLAQSNSINRFVGKKTGLYPADDIAAAKCDEIMDAVEDCASSISITIGMSPEDREVARKKLAAEKLPFFLSRFEQQLKAAGGQYFAGGKLSVADLKVVVFIGWLSSGTLDHIPTDLAAGYENLQGLVKRVGEIPEVAAWRQAHAPPKQ